MAKSDATMTLEEAQERVRKALKLLDSDEAEAIIGSSDQPEEYDQLIQGVQGVMAVLWPVLKMHGLEQTTASLKAHAQAMLMLAQIVNYAYALGMRRGKG